MSMTFGGNDTVNEESDDSIHKEEQGPKDDGVVIAQPIPNNPIATSVPSAKDPSALVVKNSSALDTPPT